MSALRLCLLVIVMIAGFSAASYWSTCPYSSASSLYANPVATCTSGATCYATYCSCVGGTVDTTTRSCTVSTTVSCAQASACSRTLVTCLTTVAADTIGANSTNVCYTPLADLRASYAAILSGSLYNASSAMMACQNWLCTSFNKTVNSNCTIPYDYVCQTPVTYTGKLALRGGFAAILSNATAKAELIACLQSDLTAYLKFPTNVTNVALAADNSLLVDFVVSGSINNLVLASQIAAFGSGSTAWLVCLSAAKFASLGGNGTLGVTGIVTPTPAPTSTSPVTTPATPTPTTAAPTGAASSLSWTLAQALVAIVAVLVMA